MTMVVPCRLMTRQRSHMGLTDGRTFMSAVPVGDPTAVQVVRAQLHLHLVPREDADVVLCIFPEMVASTSCPVSSCTLNIVLGSASTTSPSTSIFSSFSGMSFRRKEVCAHGKAVRDGRSS